MEVVTAEHMACLYHSSLKPTGPKGNIPKEARLMPQSEAPFFGIFLVSVFIALVTVSSVQMGVPVCVTLSDCGFLRAGRTSDSSFYSCSLT